MLSNIFRPTKFQFASVVIAEYAKRGIDVEYDADAFAVRATAFGVFYLHNAYEEYTAKPVWGRDRVVRHYVQMFTTTPDGPPTDLQEARSRIMLHIRDRMYHEELRLAWRAEGKPGLDMAYKPFAGGHLTMEVVYDNPTTVQLIDSEKLTAWGLTLQEALTLATENLSQYTDVGTFIEVCGGVYMSKSNDCYNASRLTIPNFISELPVKGRYIAMIPNRDTIIVTGEQDTEGLMTMAKLAETAAGQPRWMTSRAFRLDNRWVPYLPPQDHPAYAAFKMLEAHSIDANYRSQTALLEAINVKTGEDIFVAKATFKSNKDGIPVSLASWANGVDTLLPRSDYLVLATGTPQNPIYPGIVDWEQAISKLGDMLEPQLDLYPERFRVRSFPSPEKLASLEMIAEL